MAQAPAPQADPFAAVRFLAGTWEGEGTGHPGATTGAATFAFELGGRALIRKSFAQFPAQGGRPAARHEDLMAIYPEGGRLRALFLDNEGHAIHYTVTPASQGAVFLSDPGPGPTFRLTYTTTAPDTVTIKFEMAPPGRPEAFTLYLTGSTKRKA
jgi:hypothetical protein